MCVETLTGVLFWSSDLLGKPFRAACFPFETLSGSLLLLLLLQIPQVPTGEEPPQALKPKGRKSMAARLGTG